MFYILVVAVFSAHAVYYYKDGDQGPMLFNNQAACEKTLETEKVETWDKHIDDVGPVLLRCVEYDDTWKQRFPRRVTNDKFM